MGAMKVGAGEGSPYAKQGHRLWGHDQREQRWRDMRQRQDKIHYARTAALLYTVVRFPSSR
jgi:hypothetical protein